MWKDVLRGERHKLKLGYYCVRLPDDEERSRKIPRSESQRLATELFDNTSPWSEIEDRGRFGIPNLVSDLSKVLVHLIEKRYVLYTYMLA
jgi:vacuolar protein sorting-associated protein 1